MLCALIAMILKRTNVYVAVLVFALMYIISAADVRNSNVVTAFAWTAWFCTIFAFLRSKPVRFTLSGGRVD